MAAHNRASTTWISQLTGSPRRVSQAKTDISRSYARNVRCRSSRKGSALRWANTVHRPHSSPKLAETGVRAAQGRPGQVCHCSTSVDTSTVTETASTGESPAAAVVRCRVVVVTERGAKAPYAYPPDLNLPPPSWSEVLQHLTDRVRWVDASLELDVFQAEVREGRPVIAPPPPAALPFTEEPSAAPTAAATSPDQDAERLAKAVSGADLFLVVGVRDPALVEFVQAATLAVPTGLVLGCAPALEAASRLLFQPSLPLLAEAARLIPWSQAARDAELLKTAHELFDRGNPNDFLFLVLLLINACAVPVPEAVTKTADLGTVWCMAKNCRKEVVGCVTDPDCKSALDCLTDCGLNDQVCSYRCIVSHESALFESFSLCVLQKHNCLRNSAQRPQQPAVQPLASFRGAPLTHDLAEQLFMGWGDGGHTDATLQPIAESEGEWAPMQWSWKVVCGQNPAYDHFPCQHQIFYKGAGGKAFWYDPVFKVVTLSGEEVWRRRHYRVKRGKVPGEFFFSVLDNGVTSLEHWRIVDVAEDLEWACFYYAGAASAAGQAYSGAVFCTRDGQWPSADQYARITAAHELCGIKLWELYQVDNSACDGAPLELIAE